MGLDFKEVMGSITNIPNEVLRPALHTLEMATMVGERQPGKGSKRKEYVLEELVSQVE